MFVIMLAVSTCMWLWRYLDLSGVIYWKSYLSNLGFSSRSKKEGNWGCFILCNMWENRIDLG